MLAVKQAPICNRLYLLRCKGVSQLLGCEARVTKCSLREMSSESTLFYFTFLLFVYNLPVGPSLTVGKTTLAKVIRDPGDAATCCTQLFRAAEGLFFQRLFFIIRCKSNRVRGY